MNTVGKIFKRVAPLDIPGAPGRRLSKRTPKAAREGAYVAPEIHLSDCGALGGDTRRLKFALVYCVFWLSLAGPEVAMSQFLATPGDSEAVMTDAKPRSLTLGFNVDLFPIIVSAAEGDFGLAGQVHVAVDRLQLRLIGAHLTNPEFTLKKDFTDHETTVVAMVVDGFLRDDLSGFWGSTGFEIWLNEIGNKNTTESETWTNGVWTLGGGYVWRFGPNFYVNPWVGMHVRMNNPRIRLGGQSFKPEPVVANASVKLGVYFDL